MLTDIERREVTGKLRTDIGAVFATRLSAPVQTYIKIAHEQSIRQCAVY